MNIEEFYGRFEKISASSDPEQILAFLRTNLASAENEGDQHAAISILNELAGYCRNMSRYDEAIIAMERAMAAMRLLGYENTVHYGTVLLNAATAYRASGGNEKALALFTGALAIFQENLPGDDCRLAAVYNNVSSIYEEAGQYPAALHNLQRALDILGRSPGRDERAAVVQTNIAMLLFRMNLEEEAAVELERAIALFKAGGGKRPGPHYAAALAGLGEAMVRTGRFSEAVLAYEEALEHIHSVFGKNRDFAITCNNCALAYEGLGEKTLAEDYREFAESIFEKISSGGK